MAELSPHLTSKTLADDAVIKVDKRLFRLVKDLELLSFINPVNTEQEKNRFFESNYKYNPQFRYRQLTFNAFEFKQKLYSLPVQKIRDKELQYLYKEIIRSYGELIDMLDAIDTEDFFYNSLRYFGCPDKTDVDNAKFILYAPENKDEKDEEYIPVEEARKIFQESTKLYGFRFKVEVSDKMAAKAEINSQEQTLYLRKGTLFSDRNLQALVHHEIGVHMVTTKNSRLQPYLIFRTGLPDNTMTQEGLAILSEYCSGNLTVIRLKELALRVLTVAMLVQGYPFRQSFIVLVEDYKIPPEKAFYLTARVYRGGGCTKDYLYLHGFKILLPYLDKLKELENLLIGKTSIEYLETINTLIQKKYLLLPQYKTHSFQNPQLNNQALNYLVQGIK